MGRRGDRALRHLAPRGKEVLHAAMRQLHSSTTAYHRVHKVGRTIADLIDTPLIAEALQYRKRERDWLTGQGAVRAAAPVEIGVVFPEFHSRPWHGTG